jgi:hypothetical protein
MRTKAIDQSALEHAVAGWVERIRPAELPDGIPTHVEFGAAAYKNAMSILHSGASELNRAYDLTILPYSEVFRIAWDLAAGCAAAVIVDPLGDPTYELQRRFDEARGDLLAATDDVADAKAAAGVS